MFVDMVKNSTRTAAVITNPGRMRAFYSIFINSISPVARTFNAVVIRTAGDSVICYFPETKDRDGKSCFKKVLECGLEMIDTNRKINTRMRLEGLPIISYRISADYGKHEVVMSPYSDILDLIGTTMNTCFRINVLASPDSMIIGGDLFEIIKPCHEFSFKSTGGYSISLRNTYTLYTRLQEQVLLDAVL
jgi:class 3 adenylate cyclase